MTGRVQPTDRGATSIEYGLMAFAIAATIAIVVFAFGSTIAGLFAGFVLP